MVCQLRPLMYNLGLNNPPCICLSPEKSRVKNLWQGGLSMLNGGYWNALSCYIPRANTAVFHRRNSPLANRSQVFEDCQAPRSGSKACGNPLSNLDYCLWQSALRSTAILFMAIRGVNAADRHNQRYTFERGIWQECKFHYPPFYIESPLIWCIIAFCRASFQV
jgi:hypothetical protein